MDKNTESRDLQEIQLRGERAVLYEHITRWCIFTCIAFFVVFLFFIYDNGETAVEDLFGFLILGTLFASGGFFLSFRRDLHRTAVLVFEHMRRFHRDRLKQLILDRIQSQPMGGLLEHLDRAERGISEINDPAVKTPSAGDIDNALSEGTMDPGSAMLYARLLLRQAEAGSAVNMLDIDVLRAFYGQLIRCKISILSRWSGARKKLLAELLANPAYRAEILSTRYVAVKRFTLKTAVLTLIAVTLVPVLKLDQLLPDRDKMALYTLESRMGFPKHAVRWLYLAATDGYGDSRYLLGDTYLNGRDVEKDY